MGKSGVMVTVKAKGNFGFSPHLRRTVTGGEEYTIDEGDFADALFERPEGWIPPWERETPPEEKPAESRKRKGGSE